MPLTTAILLSRKACFCDKNENDDDNDNGDNIVSYRLLLSEQKASAHCHRVFSICLLLHSATLPSQSVRAVFSCPPAKTECSQCYVVFCHWTGDVVRAVCRLALYISVSLWLNVSSIRCLWIAYVKRGRRKKSLYRALYPWFIVSFKSFLRMQKSVLEWILFSFFFFFCWVTKRQMQHVMAMTF